MKLRAIRLLPLLRTINEPDEIAHYEFGASLASDCMLDALNTLQEGVTEMEIGDILTFKTLFLLDVKVIYGRHKSQI